MLRDLPCERIQDPPRDRPTFGSLGLRRVLDRRVTLALLLIELPALPHKLFPVDDVQRILDRGHDGNAHIDRVEILFPEFHRATVVEIPMTSKSAQKTDIERRLIREVYLQGTSFKAHGVADGPSDRGPYPTEREDHEDG